MLSDRIVAILIVIGLTAVTVKLELLNGIE